jgi:hypothetical protein
MIVVACFADGSTFFLSRHDYAATWLHHLDRGAVRVFDTEAEAIAKASQMRQDTCWSGYDWFAARVTVDLASQLPRDLNPCYDELEELVGARASQR